ncbi:MAG: hypothetical protein RMZ43_002950 [Nostoc sp. CmiVER01]|uniref:hypothetical protein n=1 Tax=Nostoc sp. CmiVER01 TaxID=3075384 RepID=UPI002AD218C5|nr:hypothetical protein [Nostoc sp. CmiVER01]MDZ8124753.1 hypothetical protein [Nostoc sp. CmiVER01]
MSVSIVWNDFFNNYLRSVLNDTATTILDNNRCNLLTLTVVSDLQSKGLIDIQATLSSGAITSLQADVIDAWNLIGFGVKYYYVNDPVVKYDSASGTSITRDRELIEKAQTDYFLHLKAYITINKLATLTAAQFWTQKDVVDLIGSGASKSCCKDTLEEKLAIIEAEKNAKLAQIGREEDRDINLQDQKRLTAIELKAIDRKYKLEDREALREKQATNGAWTSAGQFTISYLVDYGVDMSDTVAIFSKKLDNTDFAIPTLLQAQTYIGQSIPNSGYRELNIEITASANITYTFKALVGLSYEVIGIPVTDNNIVKRYSLANTTAYRIEITGTEPNTEIYIDAEALS